MCATFMCELSRLHARLAFIAQNLRPKGVQHFLQDDTRRRRMLPHGIGCPRRTPTLHAAERHDRRETFVPQQHGDGRVSSSPQPLRRLLGQVALRRNRATGMIGHAVYDARHTLLGEYLRERRSL